MEPRKGRNPGKRPQKQMRTPEGWHKAWRKNAALFQNAANTKNTRPQRLGAPLRYGPRHYMSAYAASLTLRRSGLNFIFSPYPRLRRYAACLGLLYFRPALRGLKFRSPTARNLFFNFRFIALPVNNCKRISRVIRMAALLGAVWCGDWCFFR